MYFYDMQMSIRINPRPALPAVNSWVTRGAGYDQIRTWLQPLITISSLIDLAIHLPVNALFYHAVRGRYYLTAGVH